LRQSTKIHTQYQGLQLLFYRAALPLSRKTLSYVAGIVRRHRKSIGSRWRKLNPGQQALLVLAYLRKGETFAELAAGFGVGTATAWRYVEETVALLAARAPKLRRAVRDAKQAGYAYVVLDGTLISIDPGRRGPALLLRQEARHEPAGHRPAPTVTSCGCPGRCPARCTTRRPPGSGMSWPSWRPRAWSPWPTRATRGPRTRRSH
jgi:Helix-turn-helix of DDE superfamily endonuclease